MNDESTSEILSSPSIIINAREIAEFWPHDLKIPIELKDNWRNRYVLEIQKKAGDRLNKLDLEEAWGLSARDLLILYGAGTYAARLRFKGSDGILPAAQKFMTFMVDKDGSVVYEVEDREQKDINIPGQVYKEAQNMEQSNEKADQLLELSRENTNLEKENIKLTKDLESEKSVKERLDRDKEKLANEKEMLITTHNKEKSLWDEQKQFYISQYNEFKDANVKLKSDLENIKDNHARDIKQMQSDFETQKDKMKSDFKEQINTESNRIKDQLNNDMKRYDTEIQHLKEEKHNLEMQRLELLTKGGGSTEVLSKIVSDVLAARGEANKLDLDKMFKQLDLKHDIDKSKIEADTSIEKFKIEKAAAAGQPVSAQTKEPGFMEKVADFLTNNPVGQTILANLSNIMGQQAQTAAKRPAGVTTIAGRPVPKQQSSSSVTKIVVNRQLPGNK